MTGKDRELVEVMKKRKLEMLWVQETRWGGNSAREIEEGYKITYSGGTAKGKRNGVGVVLNEEWKEKVMEVDRCSDRLIRVKLVTRDGLLNIISAYSPQAALKNEEKEAFWDNFEQMVRKVPDGEKAIICGDLNAHIGRISEGFKNTHGGVGYGKKNDDGDRALEVAQSLGLVFANTLFKKKEEHLVTYKSGGSTSQIDFILVKRKDRKEILNCEVIPGEDLTKQHRLIVMDYKIRKGKKVENVKITKLRVWKLQDIQSKIQFQNKVKEEMSKREKKMT